MKGWKIRLILRLLILVIKTGQVKSCLRLAIWVIRSAKDCQEAQDRLDGTFYERQVTEAADRYREAHPEAPDFTGIPGMDRWLRETR